MFSEGINPNIEETNTVVLSCRLKIASDSAVQTSSGSSFHHIGARREDSLDAADLPRSLSDAVVLEEWREVRVLISGLGFLWVFGFVDEHQCFESDAGSFRKLVKGAEWSLGVGERKKVEG